MAKRVPNQRQVSKTKQVRSKATDPPTKETKSSALQSAEHLNPSWQLSKIEMVDPYGWHQLDSIKLRELKRKLQSFESMTWSEILIVGKKQHHSVDVDKLEKEARNRLVDIKLDDVESLVSLRVSGRERIWGIKKHSVLLLLWWDPDHRVCKSTLKHT